MKIAIIKYNAGNTKSVEYALERLGVYADITDDHEKIRSADKVIFPGVGNAATAIDHLKEKQLDKIIKELKQPVLGVCLGLQLLCEHTEEGDLECLGIFNTRVRKFNSSTDFKVPHVGWNQVEKNTSSIMKDIADGSDVYFVHSYYAEICEYTGAVTDYIQPFSAVLQKDNFYAAQFHIEKSGGTGETILKNFIQL